MRAHKILYRVLIIYIYKHVQLSKYWINMDQIKLYFINSRLRHLINIVQMVNQYNFLLQEETHIKLRLHRGQHQSSLPLKFLAALVHRELKIILQKSGHQVAHEVNRTMMLYISQILRRHLTNQWLRASRTSNPVLRPLIHKPPFDPPYLENYSYKGSDS